MALAIYIKEVPPIHRQSYQIESRLKHRKRDRFFFGFISLLGISSIIFAIWPYIFWQVVTLPKLKGGLNDSPIPSKQVLSNSTISNNIQIVQDPDGFSFFTTTFKPQGPRPVEFFLTVPKLKIERAKVKVDSTRFDTTLAHFPGSALPGQIGNSFITGHSVLPQFNDPENYRAIFTKLSDLEIGDDIIVEIEGKVLNYIVQYAKVVDPQDLSVLAPISQSGRNLTLMTCVPPGTNLKRLVVITSLI